MPGEPVKLGPYIGGLHNASGSGEFIENQELFELTNLEVDTDGSLANRPAIRVLPLSIGTSNNMRMLGTYLPTNGDKYIVFMTAAGVVRLANPSTGAVHATTASCFSLSVVQYNNRLWVVPQPGTGSTGGYFESTTPGTLTWTAVAAIPAGSAGAIYKDRLFITAGTDSSTNSSRLFYSAPLDPTVWTGEGGFVDIEPGNGEKLVSLVILNNDIILFKQHSTFRYGYSRLPAQAEVSKISSTIGTPAVHCTVTYDNNNVYVMHDNSVYELYNYTFTRISTNIAMTQVLDATLFATDIYGLTLYRDRLFVRYYSHLYVYSLKTGSWSKWTSPRKFSRLFSIPSADVGLDTAFASSSSTSDNGKVYFLQDDRITGVGGTGNAGESFECKIVTKTYDYDIPYAFKVMFWWGLSIATTGITHVGVNVPNAGRNPTWDEWKAAYTWDSINAAGISWSSNDKVIYQKSIPSALGGYARKFLKLPKKLRFRQAYFTVATEAKANTIGDASVRIFDITTFMLERETVVKETS